MIRATFATDTITLFSFFLYFYILTSAAHHAGFLECYRPGMLQAETEEAAEAPFVLVDHHHVVVEDRVVHGEGDAGEVAW